METSKAESVQRAHDSKEHVPLCQTASNRISMEIQAVPWGDPGSGSQVQLHTKETCFDIIRELSTWVIHTKTWPRDVVWGGHPYLTSQINKFSLTMWTRQEVAHSPYQIQTKNLSSLTVSPQRTLLLKEGNLAWDPPLGFSQSFHRHLPRALFFQVLIEMKQRICFP